MKKFKFDISADIRIDNIVIEADSEEEALIVINNMSAHDLISEGYPEAVGISDASSEVIGEEREMTVDVHGIEWDTDWPNTALPTDVEGMEVDVESLRGEIGEDDIREAIEDELFVRYGEFASKFSYKEVSE